MADDVINSQSPSKPTTNSDRYRCMDNRLCEAECTMRAGLNQLNSLPKINKQQFITSYIGAQKTHSKRYASQGLAVMLSWNKSNIAIEDSPPRNPAIPPIAEFGFGTPVLKPRVEKKTVTREYKSSDGGNKGATALETSRTDTPRELGVGRACFELPTKGGAQPPVKRGRSRAASPDSDEEINNRLKDRRERKRIRKAITKPTDDTSTDKITETRRSSKASKRQCKGTKKRIPPGFALMHGFSATNVGKNRLTAKPPMVMGVFNKGKASERTMNRRLKQCFSEAVFLNQRSYGGKRAGSISSKTDTSDASATSISTRDIVNKKREAGGEKITADSKPIVTPFSEKTTGDDPEPSATFKQQRARDGPQSIVWDIELEISPSQVSNNSVSAENCNGKVGSVLVDTHRFAWNNQNSGMDLHVPEVPQSMDRELEQPSVGLPPMCEVVHSSPSSRPSQSASQSGRNEDSKRIFSKYFPSGPSQEALDEGPTNSKCPNIRTSAHPLDNISEADEHELDVNQASLQIPQPHIVPHSDEPGMFPPSTNELRQPCGQDALDSYAYEDWPCNKTPTYRKTDFVNNNLFLDAHSQGPGAEEGFFPEEAFSDTMDLVRWFPQGSDNDVYFYCGENDTITALDYQSQSDCYQYLSDCGPIGDDLGSGCDFLVSSPETYEIMEVAASNRGALPHQPYLDDEGDDYPRDLSEGLSSCLSENQASDNNSVESPHPFNQGRVLLGHWFEQPGTYHQRITSVEARVAKRLKNHWLPQKL